MKQLFIPLLCLTIPAFAGSNTMIEARAFAMGNTGVASATPGAAPIYNPALLSMSGSKRNTQIILPGMGFMLAVDADAQDGYKNIDDNDYFDTITNAVDGINGAVNTTDNNLYSEQADIFSRNTRQLTGQLNAISGEPVNASGGGLFSVASTNQTIGFAVYANADMQVEVTPNISSCDLGLLQEYSEVIPALSTNDYATANPTYTCHGQTLDLITAGQLNDPSDQLTSGLFVGAVIQSEVGVALSHALDIKGMEIAVGITPKILSFTSQVAVPSINDLDDDNYDLGDDLEASENDADMFNLDVGVATRFLNNSLTVGFVAKNLISDSFKTAADANGRRHEFDIKPQASAGVAYNTGAFTVVGDLDLTANQAFFNGEKSQYLSAGLEYILFSFLDLRAGARSDLATSGDLLFTTGLGLNIWAVNLDLSVQANDSTAGLALQVATNF